MKLCRACQAEAQVMRQALTQSELAFIGQAVFSELVAFSKLPKGDQEKVPREFMIDGIAASRKILLACPDDRRQQTIEMLKKDGLEIVMGCHDDLPKEALH